MSYAIAVYAVIVCPSVCPSVRPSQVGVVQRWLNLRSHKQRHTIAQGLLFPHAKNIGNIPTRLHPTEAPNRSGIGSNRYISETVQDRDIYLLWKANMNSYALYRTALFSMTLGVALTTQNHPIFYILQHLSYFRNG